MNLLSLGYKSLKNRRSTTILTLFSIALSVILILGIQRIRQGAKQSFESTVSGVDLIVGARSGPTNLLLYSVFRIGNATNNFSFDSFEELLANELVEWAIPISLGDSHRGYKVVGTTDAYFDHFKFSGSRQLEFDSGQRFNGLFDVVIGSQVADKLNYVVGDKITLSHGTEAVTFQDHADKPFTVVGVLKPTGTPVDFSLHVSLKAIEAIHADWQNGAPPLPGEEKTPEELMSEALRPTSITAAFVRLKSRIAVFKVQREINENPREAMMAILPGVSLRDLWTTLGFAERALMYVSFLVFFVSLLSMLIALLSSLNERRREMAIFRSVGAPKSFVFMMLVSEAFLLALLGVILGLVVLQIGLGVIQPILEGRLGLRVGVFDYSVMDIWFLAAILGGSVIAGIIPGIQAYRNSVADGLMVKS